MNEKVIIDLAYKWFEKMWSVPDYSLTEELVDSNYHPDWIMMELKGPKLLKHEINYFRSIFPDLKYKIIESTTQESKVWLRYKAQGTQKGDFWGFKSTNKFVEFEGAAILYFNKKYKVIDLWESFCFYDILEELKLVPPFWDLHKYFNNYTVK